MRAPIFREIRENPGNWKSGNRGRKGCWRSTFSLHNSGNRQKSCRKPSQIARNGRLRSLSPLCSPDFDPRTPPFSTQYPIFGPCGALVIARRASASLRRGALKRAPNLPKLCNFLRVAFWGGALSKCQKSSQNRPKNPGNWKSGNRGR